MSASLERWIVKGSFVTRSPLSIRTGAEEEGAVTQSAQPSKTDGENAAANASSEKGTVQAIEIDCVGNPFIPGTAIKGMLRALAAATIDEPDLEKTAKRLFGDLPRLNEEETAKVSLGGALICNNAWIAKNAPHTEAILRGRTAIHRGTRTALDGQLRHDRAVPAGTHFDITFVLDGANEDDVHLLCALLERINGESEHSALGSGTGQGDGVVAWICDPKEPVQKFGQAQMAAWLEAKDKPWMEFAEPEDITKDSHPDLGDPHTSRVSFKIALAIDGHFLVSEPNSDKGKTEADKEKPDLVPFGAGLKSTPVLPGSSLDGALSSQAARIWSTMAEDLTDWSDKGQPNCHRCLFGDTTFSGLFRVSNFTGSAQEPKQLDFVAIDRFTGGSLDGAKFAVNAYEAPVLKGQIALTFKRKVNQKLTGKPENETNVKISPSAIGLLALTLKDLAQGDVPLGYGTRKGLGRVGALTLEETGGWRELLLKLGKAARDGDGPLAKSASDEDAIRDAVRALEAEAAAFREDNAKAQEAAE